MSEEEVLNKPSEEEFSDSEHNGSKEETETTEYVCDICGKKFEKESSLIAHKIRAHAPKKEGGRGVKEEIVLPEEEDPISILEDLLSKYKSKTLTEDVKEYILDLAKNKPDGLKPKELYAELMDWGVQEKTAKKIAKLYKIRLERLMSKSKSDDLEDEFEIEELEDKSESDTEVIVKRIEPKPKKKKKYVIIVDGVPIETDDAQEFLAWKRYLQEQREHELRLKKLEEEIKAIAAKSQEKPQEEMVEIPIGDITIKVPQSMAMFYLFMNRSSSDKELVEIEIEGRKVKVPPEVAVLYDIEKKKIEKREEYRERKEVEELRSLVRSLQNQTTKLLDELKKRDEIIEKILKGELNIGTGKTLIDVLDARARELNQTAQMLINRLPAGMVKNSQDEPKYIAKRTPEEREKIAENIIHKLEKSEELLEVENEILEFGK